MSHSVEFLDLCLAAYCCCQAFRLMFRLRSSGWRECVYKGASARNECRKMSWSTGCRVNFALKWPISITNHTLRRCGDIRRVHFRFTLSLHWKIGIREKNRFTAFDWLLSLLARRRYANRQTRAFRRVLKSLRRAFVFNSNRSIECVAFVRLCAGVCVRVRVG